MSDQPTLYEHCPAECGKHTYGRRMQRDFCGVCKNEGYVVRVPCVHGNYARHIVGYGERMNTFAMCDGVGEEPRTRTVDGYYQ